MRLNAMEGTTAVYEIERGSKEGWNAFHPETNHTGEPPLSMGGTNWKAKSPLAYAFSACGECWQKTGIHGVFDEDAGISALRAIAGTCRGERFRLVKRTYSITTEQVAFFRL